MPATSEDPSGSVVAHARCCLISDLHLAESRPALTGGFLAFLADLGELEALYILGDLFDAWIGDDDDRPLAAEIAAALRAVVERGTAVYLMPGNRDFLIGTAFCSRAGARLLDDPVVHRIGATPTLLLHGDSLCTDDADYQAFRRMTREQAWQDEVLALPLAERRALAAQLREASREANSLKAEDIMDVNAAAVREALTRWSVSQMIHGHTHRPDRHSGNGTLRWVLGDWSDEQGWRLDVSGGEMRLSAFPLTTR
jgi:UDP-2,3-diacylglucosamine hydrolase